MLDELNVKELVLTVAREDLVSITVKPNLPVLGKKAGPAMKEIAARIGRPPPRRSAPASRGRLGGGSRRTFTLTADDVLVVEASSILVGLADGTIAVAVDTTLDRSSGSKGWSAVRPLIQALRKAPILT